MENIKSRIIHAFEIVAALMMAAMFATFILQVTIRYTARAEWIKEIFPFLDPTLYGWTLDFCLLMWIWMVFWGNGFIVRQRDHVIFDMLYTSVSPKLRKWLAIISALIISVTLIIVIEPTWSKFYILRLKKTATLSNVFGDWIRVRDIYLIFFIFCSAVSIRYLYRAYFIYKNDAEFDLLYSNNDEIRSSNENKNVL